MRIEDTAGNVTYIINDCDCGLTGGCERCQPLYLPAVWREGTRLDSIPNPWDYQFDCSLYKKSQFKIETRRYRVIEEAQDE